MKVMTKPCILCHERDQVEVPAEGYTEWQAGALIQEAMPGVAKEVREQLISGTHPECFEKLFGEE